MHIVRFVISMLPFGEPPVLVIPKRNRHVVNKNMRQQQPNNSQRSRKPIKY